MDKSTRKWLTRKILNSALTSNKPFLDEIESNIWLEKSFSIFWLRQDNRTQPSLNSIVLKVRQKRTKYFQIFTGSFNLLYQQYVTIRKSTILARSWFVEMPPLASWLLKTCRINCHHSTIFRGMISKCIKIYFLTPRETPEKSYVENQKDIWLTRGGDL